MDAHHTFHTVISFQRIFLFVQSLTPSPPCPDEVVQHLPRKLAEQESVTTTTTDGWPWSTTTTDAGTFTTTTYDVDHTEEPYTCLILDPSGEGENSCCYHYTPDYVDCGWKTLAGTVNPNISKFTQLTYLSKRLPYSRG